MGLYEKLGFVKDPEGIRGMAFQRRKKEQAAAAAQKQLQQLQQQPTLVSWR